MKILVIGASGSCGRWFVDYLLNTKNFPKEDLYLASRHNIPYFEKLGLNHYSVDVSKVDSFNILPPKMDSVILFAGAMPARMKSYNPQVYVDTNITGMINVLEYCRVSKAERLLFTTSFGDIKDNAEKDMVLRPYDAPSFRYDTDHTVYVMSKNFAVDLMHHYSELYNIKSYVFRLPTIHCYSPLLTFYVDGKERPIGYRYMINRIIEGHDVELWGDPNRKKDMIYVKDLCRMMYLALSADKKFSIYNVGTGIGTTLQEQIEGMIKVFGKPGNNIQIVPCPDKPNAPQYIMDISNAEEELGYRPKYNYEDMLWDIKKEMQLKRFEL